MDSAPDELPAAEFSGQHRMPPPKIAETTLAKGLQYNQRLKMDGLRFLAKLPERCSAVAFFDPQYRGVLDKLRYGNEGQARGKARASLPQMPEPVIAQFVRGIDNALAPSGYLFLWMDKFHLCNGFRPWLARTTLDVVDLVTWNKQRLGMGYRTRRMGEYLVILKKSPRRAKNVRQANDIPDVWSEAAERTGHPHKKPIELQRRLIEAVSKRGDVVIDPAAGSFSTMVSAHGCGRNFLGCDING